MTSPLASLAPSLVLSLAVIVVIIIACFLIIADNVFIVISIIIIIAIVIVIFIVVAVVIRDLKILDAAALKNTVTSERVWVVTATFAREKETLSLRCASGGRNKS